MLTPHNTLGSLVYRTPHSFSRISKNQYQLELRVIPSTSTSPPLSANTMAKVYHGSCLCRSVQYTITGEPFTFVICHCPNCKKGSGSAFMSNAFFKPEQVVLDHGKDTIKQYRDTNTTSGSPLIRHFCPTCGASLFLSNDDNKFIIVGTGNLDDPYHWVPRRESFPQCRNAWVTGLAVQPKAKSKSSSKL
ncbi:hypothetical protein Hypma_008257 [Hypsizygus marmoreus]|uniref:CENP-V/GFA domain-containing protein n=1 Tax=Hypsizygus marmoreus TaxID=39966 RepID=A0A369JQN6_HYPMA|nr:hypothetical protein Hypma_008257 [Hypsizygus marmoreus]